MPPSDTVAPKRLGFGSRLGGTLFFGVFLVAGLLFETFMVRTTILELAPYGWTSTRATIVSSEILPPRSDEDGPRLHVAYTYTFAGTARTSEQITPGATELETDDAFRLAEKFSVGADVPCWVDPKNPEQAVLQRRSPFTALLVFFPLIFVAVGAIGIWAMWRTGKDQARAGEAPLSSRTRAKTPGRGLLALFFGVFLLVGLGLGYAIFLKPLLQIIDARSWKEVPCEIVSSRVRTHDGDDGDTYSVDVVYRYSYGERHYTANRYHFFSGSSSGYAGKAEVVQHYRPGSRSRCFVNASDPTEAVLNREPSAELWLGLIPFVFALVGFFGIRYALRAAKPAVPLAPTLTGLNQPSAVNALHANVDAPMPLRPTVTRHTKLFGLLFFAVFWNGIVSIFVYNVVSEWRSGAFPWFLTLFLIPFVAVGLAVIGGVVHQFMALFNPRARLTLSRSIFCPGDSGQVEWQVEGRTDRLQNLRMILEGREEATYRRGTNSRTDRSVFSSIVLLDTTDPTTIRAGTTALTLPPSAMHTFASGHNKIVWSIKLQGKIARWPDIDDEYPFTVTPKPLP